MRRTGRHFDPQPDDAQRQVAREPPRPHPLLAPALGLVTGIACSEWFAPAGTAPPWPATVVIVAVLAWLLRPARHFETIRIYTAALCVLALAVGFLRHQAAVSHPPHHLAHALQDEPTLTRICGRIVTSPIERPPVKRNVYLPFDPPPATQFVLAADEIHASRPVPTTGNLNVSIASRNLNLHLGQRVELTGTLYRHRGPRNPGERNWAAWYRYQGISAGLTVEGAAYLRKLPDPPHLWSRIVNTARSSAQAWLLEPHADVQVEAPAQLLTVMVLGQRRAADRDLNEAFLRVGGLHFLAVSGFHVGVLAAAAWWLGRLVWRRGTTVPACTMIVVTLAYAIVAEPNAPILRATILVILAALAIFLRRPMCVLNWISAGALCVLLANPLELFRPSFQMSFVMVLGLFLFVPAIYRQPSAALQDQTPPPEPLTLRGLITWRLHRWAHSLLAICLCAWIVSLPLTAFHFGRVAVLGWLGTLIISLPITFVIVLSFITLLGSALIPPAAPLLHPLLDLASRALLTLITWLGGILGIVIERSPPPLWLVIATYAALLAAALLWQHRKPGPDRFPRPPRVDNARLVVWGNIVGLLLLAWVAWIVLPPRDPHRETTFHVLSVGNGLATILTTPTGVAVCDVGTDTNTDVGLTTLHALRHLGARRISKLLISHANVDHYSGLPTLASHLPISDWFVSPYFTTIGSVAHDQSNVWTDLTRDAGQPNVIHAGQALDLGDAHLEILWPPPNLPPTPSANDTSLVVKVTTVGRSLLLTGDIETDALEAILEAEHAGQLDLHADVLVAPHHGAVHPHLTADFLAAVAPRTIIVSSRRERPRFDALAAEVLGPAVPVLRTGELGAVAVRITRDGQLSVATPYANRTASSSP